MPIQANLRERSAVLAFGALLLCACGETGNEVASERSTEDIAELLKNVDPRVCVVGKVQRSMVGSINPWAQNQLQQMGETLEFNSVSASDTNRDISEVTCNGNILLSGNNRSVIWKVRPALDSGGYVVGTPNNENLRYAVWVEVRRRQAVASEQSRVASSSEGVGNNDVGAVPTTVLSEMNTPRVEIKQDCLGFFNSRESAMGLMVTANPAQVRVDFTDAEGMSPTLVTQTSSGFSFAGKGALEGGEYRVECHQGHLTVIPPAGSYLGGRRVAGRDTVNIFDAGLRDGWWQRPE